MLKYNKYILPNTENVKAQISFSHFTKLISSTVKCLAETFHTNSQDKGILMSSGHWQTLGSGFNLLCKFREMKKFLLGLREQHKQFVCLCTKTCWDDLVLRNLSPFLKVVGHLQSITGIALESIAAFSYAILTHSVGASTPGRQQPIPPHLAARALRSAASSNTWGGLDPPNINSLPSMFSFLPLFTFILSVQKFQVSVEPCFVFQLLLFFLHHRKVDKHVLFVLSDWRCKKLCERKLVKLDQFCLTRYLWLFFNCSFH